MLIPTTKVVLYDHKGLEIERFTTNVNGITPAYEQLELNKKVAAAVVNKGFETAAGHYVDTISKTLITRQEFEELKLKGLIIVKPSKPTIARVENLLEDLSDLELAILREKLQVPSPNTQLETLKAIGSMRRMHVLPGDD